MSDEYDVFLSHTDDDEPTVEELARRMRAETSLQPYLRRWMLVPGELRVAALEHAIECSKTVAVFFGPGGTDGWRDQESQLALIDQSKSRVIPVLLPGASKDSIDGFLQARTWVDLEEEHGFERLIAGVAGKAPELIIGFDPGPTLRQRLGDAPAAGWPDASKTAAPTPYRVFLSSTLDDDSEQRRLLLETIREVGMVVPHREPLGEGASDAAVEARREQLEGCDLFVMLVSWRYGEVPSEREQSLIELEYEWARRKDMPRLVFVVDEGRPVVVTRDFDARDDRWSKQMQLQALKDRLEANEAVIRFTPDNIGSKVTHNLHQWRNNGAMIIPRLEPQPDASTPETETALQTIDTPQPPRPARDLSEYLEVVEEDSATTTMLGPEGPSRAHCESTTSASRSAPSRHAPPTTMQPTRRNQTSSSTAYSSTRTKRTAGS